MSRLLFPALTVDPEAKIAYMHIRTNDPVVRTIYTPANVDLDEYGNIVGIELLEWDPQ